MIATTLNRTYDHIECKDEWEQLLKGLGKAEADDEPFPFAKIVEINGLYSALRCCCAEPQYEKEWRSFTDWCGNSDNLLPNNNQSFSDNTNWLLTGEKMSINIADEIIVESEAPKTDASENVLTAVLQSMANAVGNAFVKSLRVSNDLSIRAANLGSLIEAVQEKQKLEFLRIVTDAEHKPVSA